MYIVKSSQIWWSLVCVRSKPNWRTVHHAKLWTQNKERQFQLYGGCYRQELFHGVTPSDSVESEESDVLSKEHNLLNKKGTKEKRKYLTNISITFYPKLKSWFCFFFWYPQMNVMSLITMKVFFSLTTVLSAQHSAKPKIYIK